VVSLRDQRTGREWLTQGEPPDAATLERWAAEESVYGGQESFGWDECLPSVTRCADPLHPAGPWLRDHGDQWGRACEVAIDAPATAVTTTWPSPRWPLVLARRLSLPGDGVLRAVYTVTSHAEHPVPLLWSVHPALQLEPGSRIELPGVSSVRIVGVVGWPIAAGDALAWPEPVTDFDLGEVRDIGSAGAAKLYAMTTLARARTPDGSVLTVEADGELVRTMGVWLDAGGWPLEGVPIHQTVLEPTGSPDDHVAGARAHDRAWVVPPNGSLRWWISMRLEAHASPQAVAKA
jgi:hypothetical protein